MTKIPLKTNNNQARNILEWLVCGEVGKRTRFHDQRGNLVDFTGMAYAPRAFISSFLRASLGYRPTLPWISYRAIREIQNLMQKDFNVLEFGSGMSTVWLAQRCRFLHSIENDKSWHKKVIKLLEQKGLNNVKYDYRDRVSYADISEYEDYFFDFILVDGIYRDECIKASLKKLKPLGVIYLDNSDKTLEEIRRAEQILLEAVKQRNGESKYFIDFAPCQFSVNQGLFVRL
jgi:protein-L-isoaspartate O-methyltransferase